MSGPTALQPPVGVTLLPVTTAREMHQAVMSHVAEYRVFIAVAAVADWRVASVSTQKIKKQDGRMPALEFEQNPDILADVAALPSAPYCVGFAAESQDLIKHAREKLARKKVSLIVANVGPETFGRDDNALTLVDARGERELSRADKLTLARELVREIAQRLTTYTA